MHRGGRITALATLAGTFSVACAPRTVELGYTVDARCTTAWADAAFADADSTFITDPGRSRKVYETLRERYPHCALLPSRIGDAALVMGDIEGAYDAYEGAIASDQCEIAALVGRTLLDIWGHTTPAKREQLLVQLNAEGTCPGGELLRHVSWRLNEIAGLSARAARDLRSLDAGGVYGAAARVYGRDLVRTVPEGGIFITSSPVEADLALLVEPGSWTPLGRLVVDATLLDHREYVSHLHELGLPLGMSADDVARLVPYWDDDAERHISVREQVLRDLIGTPAGATDRPAIALSRTLRDPWLIRQSARLTAFGLVLALDAPPGRLDFERRFDMVMSYDGDALKHFDPVRFPSGSAYLAADVHLTLSRYLEVAYETGRSAREGGKTEWAHDIALRGLRWAKAFDAPVFVDAFQSLVPDPSS